MRPALELSYPGLAIYAFATGNALAVGLFITLVIAGVTGLVLERTDSSRKRKPDSEATREKHWGYHGRPARRGDAPSPEPALGTWSPGCTRQRSDLEIVEGYQPKM